MTTTASHLWRPSNARYVQIDGFVPMPRGPQIPPPQALAWPEKDPGDTLDYVFDIAPALTANPGDGIRTLDVTVSPANPGDLTLVRPRRMGQSGVVADRRAGADELYGDRDCDDGGRADAGAQHCPAGDGAVERAGTCECADDAGRAGFDRPDRHATHDDLR